MAASPNACTASAPRIEIIPKDLIDLKDFKDLKAPKDLTFLKDLTVLIVLTDLIPPFLRPSFQHVPMDAEWMLNGC